MNLETLLDKWLDKEGGAERANYQMFLTEFAQAMKLQTPDPKGAGLGDYQFEAPVKSEAALGRKGTGRIDLYKRDCFILEAKQSQIKEGEQLPLDAPAPPPQTIHNLFGDVIGIEAPRGKLPPRYDRLMADARLQAERYALALPGDHKAPPFLIVADIGRSFELYFDWAGNGRGYGPFPDEQNFRIGLSDLVDPKVAERLRGVWSDPASIDPRKNSVQVTRDIAQRLSRVATQLEKDQDKKFGENTEVGLRIEASSLFLMRMLFCMFAEDVELLPRDSFKQFLGEARDKSDLFWRNGLIDLWSKMNAQDEKDRFWLAGDAIVRYFNGNLFQNTQIFDLPSEFKGELYHAAGKDWRAVEPAIFGTLLEQVLTAKDRAKLGAHYTPRPYVERLVQATIVDVLRPEWDEELAKARALADAGKTKAAIKAACGFHARLVAIRVLDPACGTGNFLYVAMDALLRLESEVRQFVVGLGGVLKPEVHPNQFLGLELNPRAAVIAELVLWIGWLRYRLANTPEVIGEPVLPTLTNINFGTHGGYDALLVLKPTGEPDFANPRAPKWPAADFIVGNPPFMGGKDIRERLGSETAEAMWKAHPHVPKSADLVMQWWERAADILTQPDTRLRRFGYVTTNSITQVFSRRVMERYLNTKDVTPGGDPASKLHFTLAIADHPWTRVGKDSAAVRIAMTVAEAGPGEGRLVRIMGERKLNEDVPELDELALSGTINADLTLGTNVTQLVPLKANEHLCGRGVQLMGSGFIVSPAEARSLGLGTKPGLESRVRDYRNGRDLLQRPRGAMVIDLFGLSENDVMDRYPEIYQHLLRTVRVGRAEQVSKSPTSDAKAYLAKWWIFGKPRSELRPALAGLSRYIGSTETAKHRLFQFIDASVIPDNMVIVIATDDSFHLGVLSSAFHLEWVYARCSLLGVATFEQGHRYNKTLCFDPFPFPETSPDQRAAIAAIAERLDATRGTALSENPALTMTGLYNFVAAIRAGTLDPALEGAAVKARARIVAKLHDDLDNAVATAYGWDANLTPAEIVTKLVALNAERAAEEAPGNVRWLRPAYQAPKLNGDEGLEDASIAASSNG